MKMIEYLPPFLQNIREYKEILETEDIEVTELKKQIETLLEEVIVKTASSYGLDRYEKIYNIENTSNDIEVRRFNIIAKINNKAPFTLKWLGNKLKQLVGESNYKMDMDYNNYKITIGIAYLFGEIADTLKKDLREQLPCNLIIQINIFSNSNLYIGVMVHEKEHIKLGVNR